MTFCAARAKNPPRARHERHDTQLPTVLQQKMQQHGLPEMSFAKRLRQFITMNRMSGREFSVRFEIPYRTLQDYLSGKNNPRAVHLASMAERGIDVNWLLTGTVLPHIVFDMSHFYEMKPVSGIVLADAELSSALLREARHLVDEQLRERPELVSLLGITGILMSMWSLFATYSEVVDQFADRFESARRDGWEIDRVAEMVTTPMREAMRERLRRSADKIADEKGA